MAKMGRPRAVIDLDLVERLASIQCTIREIAGVMKIPEGTLKARKDFSATYKNASENGKASLRRLQWRLAEKSAGMAIWLGKQYLGQTDKVEVAAEDFVKHEITIVAPNGNGNGREEAVSRYKSFLN